MKKNSPYWSQPVKLILFYGALIAGTAPVTLRNITGNDLWKALYSGRYLAIFHQFPHHSTFTYSPVKDFLIRDAFNWLGNLFFIGLYQLGGNVGLQLLRLVVALIVVGILHSLVNFDTNPSYLVLFVLFVYAISQKLILRNAFFSFPLTIILFWLWHNIRYQNRTKLLYTIPILLLFWANVHGSYIAGWGLFFMLIFGSFLDKLLLQASNLKSTLLFKSVSILLIIVPLVTFVKPFPEMRLTDLVTTSGHRVLSKTTPPYLSESGSNTNSASSQTNDTTESSLVNFFQNTLFPKRPFRSSEFQSPLTETHLIFVKAGFLLFLPVLTILLLSRPFKPSEWLLFLVGAFFALSYLRTVAYFPLITLPIILRRLKKRNLASFLKRRYYSIFGLFLISIWVGVVSALIFSNSISSLTGNPYHRFGIGIPHRHKSQVPKQILKSYPKRRVANAYNLGGYLIWEWWPYKKVLVDSKGSAYQDQFIRDLALKSFQKNLLNEKITLYLTETSTLSVTRALESSELWKLRLHDSKMALFEYVYDPEAPASTKPERTFRFELL